MPGERDAMTGRDFSIIIPALNEEEHIGGVLESIRKNLEGRFRYEVILVDNGSRDRTVEIARERGIVCLQAPGCSISTLRNRGAQQASADIFVFLDADVYLSDTWGDHIGAVIELLRGTRDIVTGSLYGISTENNWIERVWFAPRTERLDVGYMNGGHLIIHRDLFVRSQGFDPLLETGEDCEFCTRLKKMGARICNDPTLAVVHAGYPKKVGRFFARERWHGRGDYASLKTLVSSKPALGSLLNLFALAGCVAGAFVSSYSPFIWLVIYAVFLGGLSLAASLHRNRGSLAGLWATVFLYMVYFSARSLSLLDVLRLQLSHGRSLLPAEAVIPQRKGD